MRIVVGDACVGCGACVRDCPMGVLELSDARPVVRAKNASECIDCRHCAAVCPQGVLTLNGVSAEDCQPLQGLELPSVDSPI